MPCDSCPTRATCSKPCALLLAVLPKPDTGIEHLLVSRTPKDLLRIISEKAIAQAMRANLHCLTASQRRIASLYYHEGISQSAIARRLGIRRNSVEEILKAARLRVGRHLKQLARMPGGHGPDSGDGGTPELVAPPPPHDSGLARPLAAAPRNAGSMPPPRLIRDDFRGSDSLQSLPASADDGPGKDSALRA
jgi:hypothetical protein